MLTKRIRKQIEWHFYNYAADKELYDSRVSEIVEVGLTANYDAVGGRGAPGNPTERKGLLLNAIGGARTWAKVVEITFETFRWELEFGLMKALYIENKKPSDIFMLGYTSERTFWRARDKWLETAYFWAQSFGLLGKKCVTAKNRQ